MRFFHTAGVLVGLAAVAVLTSASAQSPGAAEKPIKLVLAHWVPPAHPLQGSIKTWAEAVKAESGGSITSAIYPAEQLGKAVDHYDLVRDGVADMGYLNPGYQPGRFPIISGAELPFLFDDVRKGTAALDTWYRKYAAREMGDIHYCFALIQDPGTFHSTKRRIAGPEDIKGLKVRPANGTIGAFVRLLGGSNVQASAGASRDLLEHGVADAATQPWGSTVLFGIDKIARIHLDSRMYVSVFVWGMNKSLYEHMSPRQKKAVDDNCTTEAAVRYAAPWGDFEFGGKAKLMAEPNQTFVPMTPEHLAAWRKAAEPLKARWADRVKSRGLGDPDQIYKDLQDAIAKYGAGFEGGG